MLPPRHSILNILAIWLEVKIWFVVMKPYMHTVWHPKMDSLYFFNVVYLK